MKKYIVIITLLSGFYLLFWAAVNFINAQEGPKDAITLQSSMGNVTFNHGTHTSVTCSECHHKGLDNPKCNTCHTKDTEIKAMTAFHKNCIDCHKEKQAGPMGCNACHIK